MSHFSLAAALLSALRVRRKHPVARDIVRFELTHPQGQDLPDWSAGAHIRLSTPQGHIRSYSLCGPVNARDHWAIAVKREANGRGGSASLIDEVHEGDELPLHGGDNLFALDPQAPEHILIAGGIGITPFASLLGELRGRQASPGVAGPLPPALASVHLVWSVRDLGLVEMFADTLAPGKGEPFESAARTDAALDKCPKIKACIASVANHENVKKWLEERTKLINEF
jgi:hypothetical protein